ncbi:uncharacterized protein DDB_G0283697 isoform X2 [Ooceraea biroi]|uniref:uncharacterized protein DDB_G0283697 isoform X2 n=1 Tax=Ooceraea biroi TaxID=2015173 RepID=UPI0005B8A75B|nr:uncharacterized protein DDB_G0283697 isoform X2 [Ooceraea biroi]
MNPTRSTNLRRDEESKSVQNKGYNAGSFLHSRTEEEKQRRREQWKIQQELERRHEKLKQQKIIEYEKKRAEALKYAKEKSSHRSRSRSSSTSPSHSWHRERSTSSISKSGTMFEKLDGSTSGTVPLFKGPEGPLVKITTTELRRIKVDIRRNIPEKGPITELKRDILDPEDVIVKRRDDEGSKPIFDRAEIKQSKSNVNEVEEQRTVVAIDRNQSASSKSHTSRRRSSSLSPLRNRSYSPAHLSFDQSRPRRDSKYRESARIDYRDYHKIDGGNGIEKHRDYKEKYVERDASKRNINRSRSRERDSHSRQCMEEKPYRDRYYDRSSERSHERRERERDRNRNKRESRSRERRDLTPHYIEPVHVPIYYSNFPRPIVVSPMVPVRGQIPPMGRGRHLMAPVRPFSPRFVPPDMYRFGPPPNPSK